MKIVKLKKQENNTGCTPSTKKRVFNKKLCLLVEKE